MATEDNAAVQNYFSRMAEIRGTGGATKETSYYAAIESLFNAMGETLKPAVICNGQLRNQGAGSPDFGLYTKQQIQKGEPRPGQIPERGVIEVKGLAEETWQTVASAQASKYFNYYRLVLVTNYREFRLIGDGPSGEATDLDRYTLASKESDFWSLASKPEQSAKKHGLHFAEFIRRVMMAKAPLSRAEDVAWFLASHAKDALATLEEGEAEHLDPLRVALESALGIKFTDKEGEHFFRSTLVQTLFYGVFSAWVVHAKQSTKPFDWRTSGYTLNVPMVKALFEEVAKPTRLKELRLMEPLDRATAALNRIVTKEFFSSFDTGAAVQHFYEPFLEAFDPALRKALGVWYTPPEIVEYMVERVDRVLREELGKPDGLADKSVYVLDPACGTGAFLVQVLKRIEKTLRQKGADGLIGDDISEAARTRVCGFEIMPAPFVIAHWRIGNYLASESVKTPLNPDKEERAAIYLTNALTGWDPLQPPKDKVAPSMFPEFEEERDAASDIKQNSPILVFIGNPPYNAYAGTSPTEEAGLVEPYKDGLIKFWGIKKFNLDELYIRFLRIAERRIATLGRGIICYISSSSYVDDQSFVVARLKLLSEFDHIYIDNLNGDARETGKKSPDGSSDPSVFSTEFNRAGIRVGTAIGLFLKSQKIDSETAVKFRNFWGKAKREQLLQSLELNNFAATYETAAPEAFNKYSFRPRDVAADYRSWPSIPDLCAIAPINGLMEKRGGALVDVDKNTLELRMEAYFDKTIDWAAFRLTQSPLLKSASGYDPKKTRAQAFEVAEYRLGNLVEYFSRPFDYRFAYYSSLSNLWNRSRSELWDANQIESNAFLVVRPARVASPEGLPVSWVTVLGDNDAIRGHAYYVPMKYLSFTGRDDSGASSQNLSTRALNWKNTLTDDESELSSVSLWSHVLAICCSPEYLEEHKSGVAIGWPRVPLPNSETLLESSSDLGVRIAALLNPKSTNDGVTGGTINDIFKQLGSIAGTNLSIAAGWGRKDKLEKVYPGKGKIKRRNWSDKELSAFATGAENLGVELDRVLELLGPPLDVYLNEQNYWSGIPKNVWEYYIGGYQVIKKWLSYREEPILGRSVTKEEARHVTDITRRLAAIILLTDSLNQNYSACRDNTYPWPQAV